MKKTTTRFLSLLLCFALALSLGSLGVFAADEDGSALEPIVYGSFGDADSPNSPAAPRYASVVNEDVTEAITDDVSWHNGAVFSEPGEYTVSADVTMNSKADGSDTNDFSGLGAALMATGKGVLLNVEDAEIETTGVAKLALFTDAGAVSVVRNSTLISNSGTIYDGYISTADQLMMVAPPWVLGLGGAKTNARTTNIMGDYSTAAYVDSTFKAGGWGALSTDSGTNMHMVVVNTTVDVEDSGYGAYTIGNSTEDYYGVTENVSTYANIMTGGSATYQSYTGGQEIEVVQFDGETDNFGHGAGGKTVATVKSDKVAEGEVVNSSITSENFGFMCHANGPDGWNIVNLLDGTSVNSKDATFLVKKVNSMFVVDNAKLDSGNGVLLQIIDNDDDYVGLDFDANWGFEDGYGHAVGNHIPTFNSSFHEEPGFSDAWATNNSDAEAWTSVLSLTNTTVDGDIWNSTGYVGNNPATELYVGIGEGANLTGIISAGAFSHTTKDAKVGEGDWSAASALGHVINKVNSNGKNLVSVALTDDAVWIVEGDSYIDLLTILDDAQVIIPQGVTLTVGKDTYTDTTLKVGDLPAFSDVSADDWYAEDVAYINEKLGGLGSGEFGGSKPASRGMIAELLYLLAGSPEVSGTADYTDVSADDYYYDAVVWATDLGVLNGMGNGKFKPDGNLTREQYAKIMYYYAGVVGTQDDERADLSVFPDGGDTQDYAVESVQWAVAHGLIEGYEDGTLVPANAATRAEAIAILHRFWENIVDA